MAQHATKGISIVTSGDFHYLENFLANIQDDSIYSELDQFAQMGVQALAAATPEDSGKAANSWSYEIIRANDFDGIGGLPSNNWSIYWTNNDIDDQGTPIVILLRYGHGTREGGYVQGRDFITPALEPVFDTIANNVWEAVQAA